MASAAEAPRAGRVRRAARHALHRDGAAGARCTSCCSTSSRRSADAPGSRGSWSAPLSLTACDQGGNESTIEITGTTPPASDATATEPTHRPTRPSSATDDGGPTPRSSSTDRHRARRCRGASTSSPTATRSSPSATPAGCCGSTPERCHEVTELGTIESAAPQGEAGLLGVAALPRLRRATGRRTSTSAPPRTTGCVRAELDGDRLGAPEPILTGIPQRLHPRRRAPGVRTRRLPLRLHRRDRRRRRSRRTATRCAGKILRITTDGEPAPGNPFDSEVWTWGHRNVQGLAFDDDDRLWASEFGAGHLRRAQPDRAGDNYGWPRVRGRRRRARVRRPAAHLVDRRGLALRAWPTPTATSGWRRCRASGCGGSQVDGDRAREPDGLLRRRLRPDAHRRSSPPTAASG